MKKIIQVPWEIISELFCKGCAFNDAEMRCLRWKHQKGKHPFSIDCDKSFFPAGQMMLSCYYYRDKPLICVACSKVIPQIPDIQEGTWKQCGRCGKPVHKDCAYRFKGYKEEAHYEEYFCSKKCYQKWNVDKDGL